MDQGTPPRGLGVAQAEASDESADFSAEGVSERRGIFTADKADGVDEERWERAFRESERRSGLSNGVSGLLRGSFNYGSTRMDADQVSSACCSRGPATPAYAGNQTAEGGSERRGVELRNVSNRFRPSRLFYRPGSPDPDCYRRTAFIRVHSCPSVVAPSRSRSETPHAPKAVPVDDSFGWDGAAQYLPWANSFPS